MADNTPPQPPLVECVPNISEGRRGFVLDECAAAIRHAGARLLDVDADPDHHRTVFTFVDDPAAIGAAVLALIERAVGLIDLRQHAGVHPRLGAVDVVPFVPLFGTPMSRCVELARETAATVAARFALPVYLYEDAALRPDRKRLEAIRRSGFEELGARMADPAWQPDFGPARPHPTAGAAIIGARPLLIAYNVNLASSRLDVAIAIASVIRERDGGLPGVKAMGVPLPHRGVVQVSMNLTDVTRTSIAEAFDAVAAEAARYRVPIADSEIVGLAPAAALTPAIADAIRLRHPLQDRILEHRLSDSTSEK
jgi:glutamate formiminotransferase